MNPTHIYHLGHARLAEMHRQARRDALAQSARRHRRSGRAASAAAGRPAARLRWAHRLGRVSAS